MGEGGDNWLKYRPLIYVIVFLWGRQNCMNIYNYDFLDTTFWEWRENSKYIRQ